MAEPRRPCILLVEDEWLVSDVVARELEDAGFGVIETATGEAALAALRDHPSVDLLLTDIRLPGGLDGWTLAEEARRLRPDLPVIYATGYSAVAPRRVPGSLFFTKPYRTAALVEAIRGLGVAPGPVP